MAAKIRLKKAGRKGQASYRVVVLDGRKPRDSKVVEDLGFYDPKTNPPAFEIDGEAALKWLKDGAKPTKAARDILSKAGVMKAFDAAQRGEEVGEIVAKDVKPTEPKKKPTPPPAEEAEAPAEPAAEEAPVEPASDEAPAEPEADAEKPEA